MGCMTSKESAPRAHHEKITYPVCQSCHESPVRDVRILCQRCKYAKATNKQIKPRSFCPSCNAETQYPGEICGACSIRNSDKSASSRLPPNLLATTGKAGSRAASSRRPHGLTIKTYQRSGGPTAQRIPQSIPSKTERSGGAGSTSRVPKSAPAKSTRQSGGSAESSMSHRLPIKSERAEGNGSSGILQGFSSRTGPSSGFEGSRLSQRLPIRMSDERAHLRVF
ncbi:uncharacterized protein LAJ45_07269 [Morchella importuna]|uniref:uncharacterized protein n=1 Tax=Morchella importuna TaxID=1174673 RepID=UPI001E8DE5B0|nr:uncharacterized protein LAJ45_07269 [Morchella importuna]KAH8148558.1 hypothetical protein LAJ45_07269 [Morchella importuna]